MLLTWSVDMHFIAVKVDHTAYPWLQRPNWDKRHLLRDSKQYADVYDLQVISLVP